MESQSTFASCNENNFLFSKEKKKLRPDLKTFIIENMKEKKEDGTQIIICKFCPTFKESQSN